MRSVNMKILMLVNWKIEKCSDIPVNKQPADYLVSGEPYWFYKYFRVSPKVDLIDVTHIPWLENIERNKLHIHISQGIKAVFKLNKYDLVVSHGMTSGVIVALWRMIFRTNCKHIVFDIGCFNSAAESGIVMKLMQYISHSLNCVIYHTKCQQEYYKKYYPWLEGKTFFVPFGIDYNFVSSIKTKNNNRGKYIICIGAGDFRDRDTLVKAFEGLKTDVKILFVGQITEKYNNIPFIEQVGKVSFTKMVEYIDNALFCVLPLEIHKYSYGQMTLLDQMSRKKCVLTVKAPSFEGYVENGKDVLFYEEKNVIDCQKKLKFLLENEYFRDQIALNAQNKVKEIINEKNMARTIEKIYNDCLNR